MHKSNNVYKELVEYQQEQAAATQNQFKSIATLLQEAQADDAKLVKEQLMIDQRANRLFTYGI